ATNTWIGVKHPNHYPRNPTPNRAVCTWNFVRLLSLCTGFECCVERGTSQVDVRQFPLKKRELRVIPRMYLPFEGRLEYSTVLYDDCTYFRMPRVFILGFG